MKNNRTRWPGVHCKVRYWGAGIAQWLERYTRDRKVAGSSPDRSGVRIFFSEVRFFVLILISVSVSLPCLTAVVRKDPGHFAKNAGGRLRLNTHTPYVCGFT